MLLISGRAYSLQSYTVKMKEEHLERVTKSRYVSPVPSADENFIIGQSSGWDSPEIPPYNLYGYAITGPGGSRDKTAVVIFDGNHYESTGSWSFHGMIEFLISEAPEARFLRENAVFFVYPLVNPDGRNMQDTHRLNAKNGISMRVANPEVVAAGWPNHNRVWNTAGLFSTIDALAPAVRFDASGRTEYFFDFHSNGTTTYSPGALLDSRILRAFSRREPDVKPTRFEVRGTAQMWAMREDGLNSPYAFTLEHCYRFDISRYAEVGRSYAMALYDVLKEEARSGKGSREPSVRDPAPPVPEGNDIFAASARGDAREVGRFIDAGEDVNSRNAGGNSPLHLAVEACLFPGVNFPAGGSIETLEKLVSRGADVNMGNFRGWTPLHYAARYGNTAAAGMLIEAGAETGLLNAAGDTPMHVAAAYGRADIAGLLLKAGADADRRGWKGLRPVDWAKRLGHHELIELLK